jgi:hypothetical protein
MLVHPSFDPVTSTWFTLDGYEAASLARLKQQLPKGSHIVGYYPHGAPPVQWPIEQKELARVGLGISNYRGPHRQLAAKKALARLTNERAPDTMIVSDLGGKKTKKSDLPKPGDDVRHTEVRKTEVAKASDKLLKALSTEKRVLSPTQTGLVQHRNGRPRKDEAGYTTTDWEVRPRSSWSETEDNELRSLAKLGYSASDIGRKIKASRSSVRSRAHRLGIQIGRVR